MTEETNRSTAAPGADSGAQGASDDRRPSGGIGKDPKARLKRRRKVSFLTLNKIDYVDYKEIGLLRRFLSDQGKILSARQTGNTAKQQRMIGQSIRRARELALIPFVMIDSTIDRRPGGRPPRRFDRGPRSD